MSNVIKVLHIVLGLQVGGLEKFVLDLIDNYPADMQVVIVCLEGNGELGQQRDDLEIYEIHKSSGLSLNAIWQLFSLARHCKIDLIHTHNPAPHFYGALAGSLLRIPVVHTKHGRNYPADKKKVWQNRFSSFLTNRIVAVSRDAAEVCLSVEKIPASKVSVILNGIDTTKFHPKEKIHAAKPGKVLVGIVARLSVEKDHQTLLLACKLLAEDITGFHLNIIGDGPLRESLEKMVRQLGIESVISFCGMRHDVPEQLRDLDIFVLSSTTEGISLTLLEAMATGLPIVATNVGGNPEVVVDGETGFIVPSKNPRELADKLLRLIADEDLRRQMGERGRKRVEEHFGIKETVRQYQELYHFLVRKR